MKQTADYGFIDNRFLKWLSILTFTALTITGFGQMPIFKRYYIADIPGLAWVGNYYITHVIHYSGAVILLTLIAYFTSEYFLQRRTILKLTKSGAAGLIFLSVLAASGILKVIANLRGVYFGGTLLIWLDIVHISSMFLLLISFAVTGMRKKRWLDAKLK